MSQLWTTFSKNLPTTERRLTELYFLAADLSLMVLKAGTIDMTFQQTEKLDSLRHIEKFS